MSIAHTMPHNENGITVNFPDTNYFQFEGCPAYLAINSKGIKEMDFVWWQSANNSLWMVELKAYYNPTNLHHRETNLSNRKNAYHKLQELYHKSIHTLCMLGNGRANTTACCHFSIPPNTTYKIVHLLHVNPLYEHYLAGLKDELNILLKPYKAMYNVSSVAIVSYQRALSGHTPLPFV